MLDKEELYLKFDPGDMHSLLLDLHKQITLGKQIAESSDYSLVDGNEIENIVLAGMGGSAIGGDLLRCYALYEMKVPFVVNRDYLLPGFVNDRTLVILSSYSGNTEETLSMYEAAKYLHAQFFTITSGGKIAELAETNGFGLVEIPAGFPPRSAVGYSFIPLAALFSFWGFIPDQAKSIDCTAFVLAKNATRLSRDVPTKENIAKQLATKLHNKIALIYSSPRFEAVATRFRGQINENGKTLAYSALFPENNHNELVGWKVLGDFKDYVQPIFLIDPDDHPRNKFRMDFVANVMRNLGLDPIFIEPSSADAPLMCRMFELIQLGDFASYYLAILNGEDPKPVQIIDKLKNALAQYTA